jgi:poly-gamma-glutamate synthesis protein (capsule biosynthesis protein)
LRHLTTYASATGQFSTEYYQPDAAKILAQLRDARRQANWVICSLHSHEQRAGEPERPLPFQRGFAHVAVEAGADAVVCHGPHVLRGVELYRGRPIFHGLGNFIFQNETVGCQPADFYEAYGLGAEATVADAFDARNAGPASFTRDPAYWESVAAWWRYESDRLVEVKLYPIVLGCGLPRAGRGRPMLAKGEQAERIIGRVAELSREFGTKIRLVDGIGVVECG